MSAVDVVLDRLRDRGLTVRKQNGQWVCQCPAHPDGNPSMSLAQGQKGAVVKCFAGCEQTDILDALSLAWKDIFDEKLSKPAEPSKPVKDGPELKWRYDNGRVVHKQRFRNASSKVWQENGSAEPELYQLAKVREVAELGGTVWLVEGESDADAVNEALGDLKGTIATTAPMGAGNWEKTSYEPLKGAHVVLVIDDDEPGWKRGRGLYHHLRGIGVDVADVKKPSGISKDIRDHLGAGKGPGELVSVADKLGEPPTDEPDNEPDTGDGDVELVGQMWWLDKLIERYGDEYTYVPADQSWYWWTGKVWSADGAEDRLSRTLHDLLRDLKVEAYEAGDEAAQSKVKALERAFWGNLKGVIGAARGQLLGPEMDLHADYINTPEGVFRPSTQKVETHSPEHRCSKITRGSYKPGYMGEVWERFVSEVLDADEDTAKYPADAKREYLQRIIGQSLLEGVREHILPILTGSGRNGKSVFASALSHAFGDYAITSDSDVLVSSPKSGKSSRELDKIARLQGARLAIMSELADGAQMDEATMKQLTGGDAISASRLYRPTAEFKASHQLMMLTNYLPRVKGESKAAWARIRCITFDKSFEGRENPNLTKLLEDDPDAVFTWAVEGLCKYIGTDEGKPIRLETPQIVKDETEAYRLTNSPIERFIAERIRVESTPHVVTPDQVFKVYEDWVAGEDFHERMQPKSFKVAFGKFFPLEKSHGKKIYRNITLIDVGTGDNDDVSQKVGADQGFS